MRQYPHKLAGIFPDRETLEQTEKLFLEAGFEAEQIRRISDQDMATDQQDKIESESTGVRDEFVREISVGTGIGGLAGAAGATGIGLGLPALYVSAPVVAPLMVLGYAATIGGLAGAIHGLHLKEDVLTSLVEDAVNEGYPVLMVHAADKAQAEKAHELMNDSMYVEALRA